jgi:Ser/Thr protein kinase RdoA (MazF antagonist)
VGTKFWIGQHLRIELRSREHNPPHVHAIAKGAEAVIDLTTLEIDHCDGFNKATLKQILIWITENKAILLEAWANEQEKNG